MTPRYHRRDVLKLSCAAAVELAVGRPCLGRAFADTATRGRVIGHPEAAKAGESVLASGGNAVDAAVTAALVTAIIGPHLCGIGGYGGHMVIAPARGKPTAIDFNTTAPAAAKPDMFPLDDKGDVKGQTNQYGWLASGVPGTMAGLFLAASRFGSRPFRELLHPALHFARDGFAIPREVTSRIAGLRARIAKDPGSANLLLPGGDVPKEGSTFRNPDLAALLQTLAEQNSVEPFYRGDIARRIADGFKKNGGLVTTEDLARYQAREVEPLTLDWNGHTIHTAPLTAGGLTVLQALAVLRELGWEKLPAGDPKTLHAQVDTLRLAWHDRLRLLGDPEKAKVRWQPLLTKAYAKQLADRVAAAVKAGKPVRAETDGRSADGTVHLSAVDAQGTMVALTMTHGNAFGAVVTVEGLGLTLGHGLSRFDPHPDHPNAPGPNKRPLHNMCPTVVTRNGRPILALGGAGGRMIPNAVFNILALAIGRGTALDEAVAAPRPHTDGSLMVRLEKQQPQVDVEFLKQLGYQVESGGPARASTVARDPETGTIQAVGR